MEILRVLIDGFQDLKTSIIFYSANLGEAWYLNLHKVNAWISKVWKLPKTEYKDSKFILLTRLKYYVELFLTKHL